MNYLKGAAAFAVSFAMLSISVQAQEAAAPAAEPAAVAEPAATPAAIPAVLAVPALAVAAPPGLMLPSYTEVILTPDAEANSKKLREGHTIPMHTVFDVMHNGVVVIPKGTRGMGTVTWRTGKGAFGKSAKMEVTFNELTLPNGHRLPLAGMHRQEGEGNTGAAIGAAIAVGVFGAFVTGKSAIIPNGQHLMARTNETLAYAIPAGAVIIPTAQLAPAASVAVVTPAAAVAPAAEAPAPAAEAPAAPAAGSTPTTD
ncbi:hypothetical protein ASE06_19130 [Sphingopyxis sp. Root214]|uniref:hypothetical protein n=2 Tax=unclassified Sphingopyxis TaxID=2614943 RepID=UPI0006F45A85|nr:hypothetical protein [Sphingopyxis sp. Root214]KQZ71529.1 hypothetical protein ASD73_16795 [Sphingopyxis sp. Root154]KRC05438.1 hypothetical protein ASE06_19130 [Sphingopyxis sp. Root214]